MHLHRSMSTARTRLALAIAEHRTVMIGIVAATWGVSFLLLLAGTVYDAPHVGRWGLFVAIFGGCLWIERMSRRVITRLTQIIKLFVEDVPEQRREHDDEPHIRSVR